MVTLVAVLLVLMILIECVDLAANMMIWKSNKATWGRERENLEYDRQKYRERCLALEKENEHLQKLLTLKHDAFETGILIHHGGTKVLPKGWQAALHDLLNQKIEENK